MDKNKEFEKNRQKMNIKELNGMDTLSEQTKELILVLDEFVNNTSPEEMGNIMEESDREDAIIKKVLGESKAFPLTAIEKLLPFIEILADRVLVDTSDKSARNLLSHACDDMATYSRNLIQKGTHIEKDGEFELGEEDADLLDKDTLIKKWEICFKGVIRQIHEDLTEKDNIKTCGHCYHLWSLSNISAIFF